MHKQHKRDCSNLMQLKTLLLVFGHQLSFWVQLLFSQSEVWIQVFGDAVQRMWWTWPKRRKFMFHNCRVVFGKEGPCSERGWEHIIVFPEMFVTPKSRKTPEGIKQLQKQENTQPQKKNGKKKKENPANALSRARHDCFLFFFCDRQQQRKFALVWPPKWRT